MTVSETVVGLIFIDNYDDVMEATESVRFALLLAFIDRELNALARKAGGIVKKFENDKYLFLLSQQELTTLEEKNFEILNRIRETYKGSKIPITLSIGIGAGGATLEQSMEYARAALDLALGRGGDQALVKRGADLSFFGGGASEVPSNTRVRARVKAFALRELIGESGGVLIMGHKNPDFDCFGAAVGVCKMAALAGKPGWILMDGQCVGIKPMYERIARDYKNTFVEEPQARRLLEDPGERVLLVIVDSHRPSYLSSPEVYGLARDVVVIDHHRKAPDYIENAVLTYHEPNASSTAELITEMLQYFEGARLTGAEADALLAGITVDTKGFTFKTGAKTFDAASFLKRNGADSVRVHMLMQYDFSAYRARAAAVSGAEVLDGHIAVAVCPDDTLNPMLAAPQAADELLNISGIDTSFVLSELEGCVYISARSLGKMNVQLIMEALGGGGHRAIAGCQLLNVTVEDARGRLQGALDEYKTKAGL